MKHKNLLLPAIALFFFTACTDAPDSDQATTSDQKEVTENTAGETYMVDATASKIEWIGTKVSGHHSGTINIKSGELMVVSGNISGGSFVMEMNSISTTGPEGSKKEMDDKLTGHLKSADFFDVEKNPEATFVITSVTPFTGTLPAEQDDERQKDINEYKVTNPTHIVSGNLTIKGTTKNIEFPAKITVTENAVDAIAKFNIDRTLWNITYPGKPDDLIRNHIHMGIALKAVKQPL